MEDVEIPEYFICPISLQIMKDPVTTITGITYDRESITHWQNQGGDYITCPVTKQLLPADSPLTPNLMLRRLIQSWCSSNASRVDQMSNLRPPLTKFYLTTLIKDLKDPGLHLEVLHKFETLAAEKENRFALQDAGVMKAMVSYIIEGYRKGKIIGLREALNVLYLVEISPVAAKLILAENYEVIDSLSWILGFSACNDHVTMKIHATFVLKMLFHEADSRVLEVLKPVFFKRIVSFIRELASTSRNKAIRATLQVMLKTCPCGRNCVKMVEEGAVSVLVELAIDWPEKAIAEVLMAVLFHLCSCADGRAQLVGHGAGIAIITKRILKVSPKVDDRAILILSLICKYLGANGVLMEMLRLDTVNKLCMVLQSDRGLQLKEKARKIITAHADVWRGSPCVDATLFTRYTQY